MQNRHRHTKTQHRLLHPEHQVLHLLGRGREVVEIALLVAARQFADQRPAAIDQVGALLVEFGLDDEKLLLPTQVGVDGLDARRQADVLQQAETLPVHGIVRPEQRRFVINARAQMGDEGTWHPEDPVQDEDRGGTVPRGERCRCVRRAEAAVRERRAVRLALEEPLVWQRLQERLRALRRRPIQVDHGVHLQRSAHGSLGAATTADREKPMGERDGTLLARPLEDRVGDRFLVVLRERRARYERFPEAGVERRREASLHRVVIEHCGAHVRQGISLVRGEEHGRHSRGRLEQRDWHGAGLLSNRRALASPGLLAWHAPAEGEQGHHNGIRPIATPQGNSLQATRL
mmetsp:Transcript_29911/g.85331  ORF Transcript_29911/g.85331 Transcript_29911/m.85331 type:complete len:346 (+) Transcript_29911:1322-2359(+)